MLKVINRTGLLYSQVAGIKNAALPEIYHVEENGTETYVVEEFLQGTDLQAYLELRSRWTNRPPLDWKSPADLPIPALSARPVSSPKIIAGFCRPCSRSASSSTRTNDLIPCKV
ncbi:MAG: hypothetical protein IJQ82_05335 [Selenomonadaceae bacterium]|nr:hypothetical protein [Selenomonadaceae bacterium]